MKLINIVNDKKQLNLPDRKGQKDCSCIDFFNQIKNEFT